MAGRRKRCGNDERGRSVESRGAVAAAKPVVGSPVHRVDVDRFATRHAQDGSSDYLLIPDGGWVEDAFVGHGRQLTKKGK